MFKEITATFDVLFDTNRTEKLIVKRMKSGAFAYGDQSCHSVELDGKPESRMIYDTRYDRIKTSKVDWLNFWTKFIYDKFSVKMVNVLSYEEKEVKDE